MGDRVVCHTLNGVIVPVEFKSTKKGKAKPFKDLVMVHFDFILCYTGY